MTQPGLHAPARAIELALEQSRSGPADIDYVNAHGTATRLNDVTETAIIKRVFGDRRAARRQLHQSPSRPRDGRLRCARVHRHRAGDPQQRRPADGELYGTRSRVRSRLRPERGEADEVRAAISNSLAFGGLNGLAVGLLYDTAEDAEDATRSLERFYLVLCPLRFNVFVADNRAGCRSAEPVRALLLTLALPAQIDPRTALLERDGWDALAAGRAHAAADAFRQALAADPRNARLHLGAGMAATLERRDSDARESFERALTLDPRLISARALLGQVLYRMGLVSDAIRAYETLTTEAPDDREAHATLVGLAEREYEPFGQVLTVSQCSFEGPAESALATQALESLDRAYWRIGQLLAVYPSEPIPVVLYTTEQFRDITRSPSWAAGAYDGTIRVPCAVRSTMSWSSIACSHTNSLTRWCNAGAARVPVWLNEGWRRRLTAAISAGRKDRQEVATAVPLKALQSGFGRFSGAQAQLAYATSALAVRRLLHEAGGFAIANLLRDIGAGVDFDTAFLHRMQLTIDDFQKTLSLY
jgi:tetratricopeptide (TPR) repeat protein